MKILVLGSSGVTGIHLVEQLLLMGRTVKVIVRPFANIPDSWYRDYRVSVIKANISQMTLNEAVSHLDDCQAVASCLGHVMSLKGIFGKPRNLVAHTVQLFCEAIQQQKTQLPFKFVLMNTVGYRNNDINEQISFGQSVTLAIIRRLLPPHRDNENAAEFLRTAIDPTTTQLEWAVVRPDSLVNEPYVSDYTIHISPTSTLFSPQKVSRINVANFIALLLTRSELWEEWRGKMPVIYNNAI